MGNAIAKIGDIAPPAMRQLHPVKLRKHPQQARSQERRPGRRVMFEITRPAAEQHPLAVRRWPEIVEKPLGVGDHPVRREQLGHTVGAKLLGRDLVGRHRHHAALVPGAEVAGIAVGGDDDRPGADGMLACLDLEAGSRPRDRTGPDAAEQADAGRLGNRKNAVMELCRVHGAAAVEQHAAMIEIRGEMVMRPIGRHHAGT